MLKNGDMAYTFMGGSLLYVKVTCYDIERDRERLDAEDATNSYCLYARDCYPTKEDAIEGMLDAIRDITDCDCGEDEAEIENYYAGFRCS